MQNSIVNAFSALNKYNEIPNNSAIFGRTVSQSDHSCVIVFADSSSRLSKLNAESKVKLSKTDSKFFSEAFRWDQSIYSIILGKPNDITSENYSILSQYCSKIGGDMYSARSLEELLLRIDDAILNLNSHKINIIFEVNNREVNATQARDPTTKSLFTFANKPFLSYRRSLSSFLITKPKINLKLQNQSEREKKLEKWPFPLDFQVSKTMVELPTNRKVHPILIIGSMVKELTSIYEKDLFDEYEVVDKNFIVPFLEDYPSLLINEPKKIYWEIYSSISSISTQKADQCCKPFGFLKLSIPSIYMSKINSLVQTSNTPPSIADFITKHHGAVKLKLCVSCYSYVDFFDFISKLKTRSTSESTLHLSRLIESIPFYYSYYIKEFLDNSRLFKLDQNIVKCAEEKYLNATLHSSLIAQVGKQSSAFKEMLGQLSRSKLNHSEGSSKCCSLTTFKNFKGRKNYSSEKNSSEKEASLKPMAPQILNFNISSFISLTLRKLNEDPNQLKPDYEISIDLMGDYMKRIDHMNKNSLRDPYSFDDKKPIFVSFDNPFVRNKNKSRLDDFVDIDLVEVTKPHEDKDPEILSQLSTSSIEQDRSQSQKQEQITKKSESKLRRSKSHSKIDTDISSVSSEATLNIQEDTIVETSCLEDFYLFEKNQAIEAFSKHNLENEVDKFKIITKFNLRVESLLKWKILDDMKGCKLVYRLI